MKLLVDTNVLIDYSKGYSSYLSILFEKQRKNKYRLFVNTIIVMEYLSGIPRQSKSDAINFLKQFEVVSMGLKEGIISAELIYNKNSNYWKDALIAANCMVNDMCLVTNNIKHFKNIHNLIIYDDAN